MVFVDPHTKACTKGFFEITPNEITFSPSDSMKAYTKNHSGLYIVVDLCTILECIYYSGGTDLEKIVSKSEAFLLINCADDDTKKKSTYYFMGKKELYVISFPPPCLPGSLQWFHPPSTFWVTTISST